MTREKILVVDDEVGIRFGIRDFLESQGYEVDEADSCQGMLEVFRGARPDAVIVDYLLPDGHALDLLPRVQPSSEPPLHRCALKPTLPRSHDLEEQQLWGRRGVGHATLG
jgi:DNA-binding NtrC family response regulator